MLKLLTWKDVFKECYLDKSKDKKLYVAVEGLAAELQEKYMEALRGMWKTIKKDLQKKGLTDEEQFKAMNEGWVSAGKAEAYKEVLGLVGCSEKQQKKETE